VKKKMHNSEKKKKMFELIKHPLKFLSII
jgi:hypothetical protein